MSFIMYDIKQQLAKTPSPNNTRTHTHTANRNITQILAHMLSPTARPSKKLQTHVVNSNNKNWVCAENILSQRASVWVLCSWLEFDSVTKVIVFFRHFLLLLFPPSLSLCLPPGLPSNILGFCHQWFLFVFRSVQQSSLLTCFHYWVHDDMVPPISPHSFSGILMNLDLGSRCFKRDPDVWRFILLVAAFLVYRGP